MPAKSPARFRAPPPLPKGARELPPLKRGSAEGRGDFEMGSTEELALQMYKDQNDMQKISPFLWFDNQAEEAVNFYISIFKNSKIVNVARYGEEGAKVSGRPTGTVMTVTFQLDGQPFVA